MAADWRALAECADADPTLFYPRERGDDEDGHLAYRLKAAQARCDVCPVTGECFDFAASFGDTYGMYGGRMFADGRVSGKRVGPGKIAARRQAWDQERQREAERRSERRRRQAGAA